MRSILKKWRKARGLSQSQAAAALGVPVRTLQDWELGRSKPRTLAAEALGARMGISSGAKPQRSPARVHSSE
jgi:transcriptional regulator with XRE-family HTH domain